jgi:hypothetical protein
VARCETDAKQKQFNKLTAGWETFLPLFFVPKKEGSFEMQVIDFRKREAKRVFTSKYVGVSFHPTNAVGRQWRAAISIDGRKNILGYFTEELKAARTYNAVAERLGRPINVLPEGE